MPNYTSATEEKLLSTLLKRRESNQMSDQLKMLIYDVRADLSLVEIVDVINFCFLRCHTLLYFNNFSSSYCVIVRVSVVLKRTVVGD